MFRARVQQCRYVVVFYCAAPACTVLQLAATTTNSWFIQQISSVEMETCVQVAAADRMLALLHKLFSK
jgi:hypothetical protein